MHHYCVKEKNITYSAANYLVPLRLQLFQGPSSAMSSIPLELQHHCLSNMQQQPRPSGLAVRSRDTARTYVGGEQGIHDELDIANQKSGRSKMQMSRPPTAG